MKKSFLKILFLSFFLPLQFLFSVSNAQSLRINEFMALNDTTLADEDGDFTDWIELFNASDVPLNLKNWSLTDDKLNPAKWIFPEITLQSKEYILIYASSKDRSDPSKPLHTNFSLKGSGEYLALIQPNGIPVSEFSPFPSQQNDFSYGYYLNAYTEFSAPTPGKDNSQSMGILLPEPVFSIKHGIFNAPFQLEITNPFSGTSIYYTTDGSIPSKTNGNLFSSKIPVSSTSVIRAVTVNNNSQSRVATQSYFFPDNIIRQGNKPAGYPAVWGPYTAISGTAIADYEMDQDLLTDPAYAASVIKSFTDIPVLSVVTNKDNLFSLDEDSVTGGIYIYTGAPITDFTYTAGRGWERPVSLEYFSNDSSFQVNCGIRIQGGHGRRPEKSPKHSFILVFDRKYGPSKLEYPLLGANSSEIFENVILRASFGNSWVHHDNAQRIKATYQEDVWTKDTQRAIGHPVGNARYMHLFINGLYWGMYTASERMDKEFAETYLGGDEDDYDVIKDYSEVADGYINAWNKMMTMANAGLESTENYYRIQGKSADGSPDYSVESLVDVVNLADYMLINFFGANSDWDHHNWAAMRSRVNPGKGFKFMCWDSEMMFGSVTGNVLSENNNNCPSRVYQQLIKNAEFKRLFSNRIQMHCFNGGVLTPEAALARWQGKKALLENVVMAEAARWGDYRRDVHRYQTAGPFELYKKDTHWMVQENFIINTYFPQRTANFISQLRTAGLFPSLDAPSLYINGKIPDKKIASVNDKLTMTTTKGTIYYSTNGADPVDWSSGTGTVNTKIAKVYSQVVSISQSAHVVARSFFNGQWSAATSHFFTVPENYQHIKITEIHYHPSEETGIDNGAFEFIELKNTGTSPLDISGMKFTRGIEFIFPSETQLNPGAFVVLGSNSSQFLSRYKFRPFDEFKGKLENAGERVTLVSPLGETVADFAYGTSGDWPTTPDGQGFSLVPLLYNPTGNQSNAADWRASYKPGGSPGADDVPVASIHNINTELNSDIIQSQCFPNPFRNITYIDLNISINANIEISVYNLMGLKVTTLVNAFRESGMHQFEWNGSDNRGSLMPDGVYFYTIKANTGNECFEITRKILLMK